MATTDNQPLNDDIRRRMEDEIMKRVLMLLHQDRAAGLMLRVPSMDIVILAGTPAQLRGLAPLPVVRALAGEVAVNAGIERAAEWLDREREVVDREHAQQEPDTGAWIFDRPENEDYSNTLADLADNLRKLKTIPVDEAPPIPPAWLEFVRSIATAEPGSRVDLAAIRSTAKQLWAEV